ncbi:hypothetical protein ACXYMP_06365 [Aliiroseovarius sp. CAU 1755]
MNDKEAIDLLEKQLDALEKAEKIIPGDREFFDVGEYDLALEGVYVAHKRHPGVLDDAEVRALVDDFGMDTAEFDR